MKTITSETETDAEVSSPELYKRYRPKSFKKVKGQESAVQMLQSMLKSGKVPHTLLFSGPSGCGKTTLARIMQSKLEISDTDFQEINCADFRGVDMVREIRDRMGLAPIGGPARGWLIDEAHSLTKDAQNAFLKILEDTPDHVYFFIATTEPTKLLPTIRTRSTEVKLKGFAEQPLEELLSEVASREEFAIPESVLASLVEHSEGSARKALVLLHQVMGIEDEKEMLAAVETSDSKTQAIELARQLLKGSPWKVIAPILKTLDDEPESLRRMILGYASSVLLNSANPRAMAIIDCFERNFFDSGKAGLIAACFAVTRSK